MPTAALIRHFKTYISHIMAIITRTGRCVCDIINLNTFSRTNLKLGLIWCQKEFNAVLNCYIVSNH